MLQYLGKQITRARGRYPLAHEFCDLTPAGGAPRHDAPQQKVEAGPVGFSASPNSPLRHAGKGSGALAPSTEMCTTCIAGKCPKCTPPPRERGAPPPDETSTSTAKIGLRLATALPLEAPRGLLRQHHEPCIGRNCTLSSCVHTSSHIAFVGGGKPRPPAGSQRLHQKPNLHDLQGPGNGFKRPSNFLHGSRPWCTL